MRKKGPTIGKTRSALYTIARALGDVQAVKRGRVTERAAFRTLGHFTGKLLGAIVKSASKK